MTKEIPDSISTADLESIKSKAKKEKSNKRKSESYWDTSYQRGYELIQYLIDNDQIESSHDMIGLVIKSCDNGFTFFDTMLQERGEELDRQELVFATQQREMFQILCQTLAANYG